MKRKLILAIVGLLFFTIVPVRAQNAPADTLKLSLENALELALNENLTLKVANLDIERVDYSIRENWYALLPSLNASAQYTNNIMKPVFFSSFFPGGKMEVGSTNSYAVAGSLQVPIFAQALYKNIQLSEIELKATLESARSSKLDLIYQVKNTFYGIVMLKDSYSVLQQSYKNAKESADNIKNMYEQGLASEYDKIRADVAVRNISPSLTQAKNSLDLSILQLKILLSLKLDVIVDVQGDFTKVENDIMNFSESGVDLSYNTTMKSLDIQIEKMNKSLELINSQRLPIVSGTMSYSLQMQNDAFKFDKQWSNSLSAGVAIQIPIFNKLSVNMKEKQAIVGLKQLEFQKSLTKDNLSMEAINSINEMKRAKEQLESDKEAVKQAQKGYEIAKVRYKTGAGTVLELNDTEVALTTSRLNLNQTLFSFLKARNEYEKVLGKE